MAEPLTKPCLHCGCRYTKNGACSACGCDAISERAASHAGELREITAAFETEPSMRRYVPALQAGTAALLSESRNWKHTAQTMRRLSKERWQQDIGAAKP